MNFFKKIATYLYLTLYGYLILLFAIFINFLGQFFGFLGWYGFLKNNGLDMVGLDDFIWLFVFYPILLGVFAYLVNKLFFRICKTDSKKIFIIPVVLLFFAFVALLVLHFLQKADISNINTFEECRDAGFPIAESYPEQCFLPNGRSFTRDLGVACTMDAKLCPDGSFVGRVAPNCEFSPCPGN